MPPSGARTILPSAPSEYTVASRSRFSFGRKKPLSTIFSGSKMRVRKNSSSVVPEAFSTTAPSTSVPYP